MSITPEEVSELQDHLQEEILESIQDFKHTTGLEVVTVSTDRERTPPETKQSTVGVDVDVFEPLPDSAGVEAGKEERKTIL